MESHTDLDTSCSHMPRCCASLPRSVTRRRRAAWFVFATGTRRISRSQAKAWGARVCSSTASAPEREGWQRHRRRFLSLPQAHFIPQRSSTSGKRGCKASQRFFFLFVLFFFPPPGATFFCCACCCPCCALPKRPTLGATLPSLATTLAVRSAVEAASVTSPIHRAFGFCGPHAAPAALCSSTVDLARPAGVPLQDATTDCQHRWASLQDQDKVAEPREAAWGQWLRLTGANSCPLGRHSNNDTVDVLHHPTASR